jgi:hypothetical protein
MSLSRRAFLSASAGVSLGLSVLPAGASLPQVPREPQAIDMTLYPIRNFSLTDSSRTQFGALTFRAGFELRSDYEGFGGFSGLARLDQGRKLVALTDGAQWLTADVTADASSPMSGLRNAVMAPILSATGRPLRETRAYDTESLTIDKGIAYIGIERVHEVMRFDFAGQGVKARGASMSLPREVKDLPKNKSLEAIGVAPLNSPLQGALVAIAERARWEDNAPTRGFILNGPRQGVFDVARSDNYEVTDLAFLPTGDILLLERRFSIFRGLSSRIRHIKGESITPKALVDGAIIFEANAAYQNDNMEGLSVHQNASGETVLTLMSDDNFSILQRTLLLEFTLDYARLS